MECEQRETMGRGELLIVGGVVTVPAAIAVVGLVWISLAGPQDRGVGVFFAVVGAVVALALGLLSSGILLLRRQRRQG